MKINNAKSLPEVFFGLHMCEGVAEYSDAGTDPYRIFIGEETIKKMDPSFKGRPVYVEHVDEVNLENIQQEADGYVIRSFYNELDGKHWAEFIMVSDRGKQAIRNGWRLSNAYIPLTFSSGGLWHGVEFAKEVTSGEYEHLAIVQNPRYEESVILTPEEFKNYNSEKDVELKKLANSIEEKGEKGMGALNFFKRTKIENALDLESTMVELPKSKVQINLKNALEELDTIKNMHGYANEDHMVKFNDEEMSVKELLKKHKDACNELEEMKKKNAETEYGGEPGESHEEKDMKNDEGQDATIAAGEKSVGDRGGDKSLDNEEDEEDMKKKEKKENAKAKAAALKNAGPHMDFEPTKEVVLSMDQVARGKARYGSN